MFIYAKERPPDALCVFFSTISVQSAALLKTDIYSPSAPTQFIFGAILRISISNFLVPLSTMESPGVYPMIEVLKLIHDPQAAKDFKSVHRNVEEELKRMNSKHNALECWKYIIDRGTDVVSLIKGWSFQQRI
jgi:hypothetical protein